MEATRTCTGWDNGDCEGTRDCPPRCPRFVDREGDPITVRPLSAEEVPPLVGTYREFPAEHRSMGLPPREADDITEWLHRHRRRGRALVAWRGERPVGHAVVSPTSATEPEFAVFVHPDDQGRGIGTELTRQAVARAAADDHEALVLYVARDNDRARHVYRRLGFETVERERTRIEMRLSLASSVAERARTPPAAPEYRV